MNPLWRDFWRQAAHAAVFVAVIGLGIAAIWHLAARSAEQKVQRDRALCAYCVESASASDACAWCRERGP